MAFQPRLLQLPQLKLAQLKTIAVACGLPSSGTKDVLSNHISAACSALENGRQISTKHKTGERILSVDLGIRNLAFSLVSPKPATRSPGAKQPPRVKLDAWSRVAVVSVYEQTLSDAVDTWSPSNMAHLTLNLVRNQLLVYRPTRILIERQRFRSSGMAAVQEWTLRVNTLEAMMHAVLRTMRELGAWEGEVISVAPKRVTQFWLNGEAPKEIITSNAGAAKARMKRAKIDLVGKWLEMPATKTPVSRNGLADATATRFLSAWGSNRVDKLTRLQKKEDELYSGKLDDLADSLLQGLAWIKWEENKATLLRDGPTALLNEA